MKFVLDEAQGVQRISAYVPGQHVVVNRHRYSGSIIVMPTQTLSWTPASFAELQAAHFAELLPLQPDCVLFGSGVQFRFPAPALTAALINQGVGIEVMDTAAACRTYSVLVAEGRQVAAALLI
jgi:uncharacterized protein